MNGSIYLGTTVILKFCLFVCEVIEQLRVGLSVFEARQQIFYLIAQGENRRKSLSRDIGDSTLTHIGDNFGTVGYATGEPETSLTLEYRAGEGEWQPLTRDTSLPASTAQFRATLTSTHGDLSPALNALNSVSNQSWLFTGGWPGQCTW